MREPLPTLSATYLHAQPPAQVWQKQVMEAGSDTSLPLAARMRALSAQGLVVERTLDWIDQHHGSVMGYLASIGVDEHAVARTRKKRPNGMKHHANETLQSVGRRSWGGKSGGGKSPLHSG